MKNFYKLVLAFSMVISVSLSAQNTLRDYGAGIGVMKTGEYNSITDVPGVKVGHVTIIEGESIRTGVTAIIPQIGRAHV